MQALFEKRRPTLWEHVVGQKEAIRELDCIRKACGTLGGRAYWLANPSGTGKTTIARLIAKEIAPQDWIEVDAQRCTLETVREMASYFAMLNRPSLFSMAQLGKVWIFNEAHHFRGTVLNEMLTALEPAGGIPECCAVVFTTTSAGEGKLFADWEDASPFLSRCTKLTMTTRGLADAFAEMVHNIAESEGLNGRDMKWYKRLAMDSRNNAREMLDAIQRGKAMPE